MAPLADRRFCRRCFRCFGLWRKSLYSSLSIYGYEVHCHASVTTNSWGSDGSSCCRWPLPMWWRRLWPWHGKQGEFLSSQFLVLSCGGAKARAGKLQNLLKTENGELRADFMSLHLILFLTFGAGCVAGAVDLVAQRHPINSALSLIAVMGALAGEYLLLGAEFLASIQLIVYAGAIMVLFVFTIMLLNAGEEERTKGSRVAILLGLPGMLIGGTLVAWVLLHHSGTGSVPVGALLGDPKTIGQLLFHEFLLPFEVTSILILIAIMGAVVLASKPEATQNRKAR